MRLKKEDCVAICLDVQQRLFPIIDGNEKLENNMLKLAKGLKVLAVPTIVTEQYPKGIGATIPSLQEVLGDEYKVIEKLSFSCWGEEKFIKAVEDSGKKTILIYGIESHVCVLQTVVDMIAEGFNVVVAADCVSSRDPYNKKIALKRMREEGAYMTTAESILFEFLERSGTEEFKAISKIVK